MHVTKIFRSKKADEGVLFFGKDKLMLHTVGEEFERLRILLKFLRRR
jgi:hypothetical protein